MSDHFGTLCIKGLNFLALETTSPATYLLSKKIRSGHEWKPPFIGSSKVSKLCKVSRRFQYFHIGSNRSEIEIAQQN